MAAMMAVWAAITSIYGLGEGRGVSLGDRREVGEVGELTAEGELRPEVVKLLTAGERGRGGRSAACGRSGTGGGASEGVRSVQIELRLLRVLDTEFFLLVC